MPCNTTPTSNHLFFFILPPPPTSTLFPYTTLFRSRCSRSTAPHRAAQHPAGPGSGLQASVLRIHGRLLRSEEHTSELQSHHDLVCRLLLEKKKEQKQLYPVQQRRVGLLRPLVLPHS